MRDESVERALRQMLAECRGENGGISIQNNCRLMTYRRTSNVRFDIDAQRLNFARSDWLGLANNYVLHASPSCTTT